MKGQNPESMASLIAKAQIRLISSPNSIYHAFVDAECMSKFWFTRRDNGLVKGDTVFWYVGDAADAFAIEVKVKDLVVPERIQIEWGDNDSFTQVKWSIEAIEEGCSILTIEESGFTGSDAEVIKKALDSTCGFNQVVVALKALLEHDTRINIVEAHV